MIDGWTSEPVEGAILPVALPEPFVAKYQDGRGSVVSFISLESQGGEVVSSEDSLEVSLIQSEAFVALLLDSMEILVPDLLISLLELHTQESMVSSGTDISVADGPATDLILSFFQLHTQRRGERIGRGERVSSVDHREWGNK